MVSICSFKNYANSWHLRTKAWSFNLKDRDVWPFLEEIKLVNKSYVAGCTFWQQPGVEIKWGDETRDKDPFIRDREVVKEFAEVSISKVWLGMLLHLTWTTTSWASGCSARMLGIFSIISDTLAPGKQKVAADFLLMFPTIESPIMSVVGGEVVGGENYTRDEWISGEGWTESGAGALCDAGVKQQYGAASPGAGGAPPSQTQNSSGMMTGGGAASAAGQGELTSGSQAHVVSVCAGPKVMVSMNFSASWIW